MCANAIFHWSETLTILLIHQDEASCEFPQSFPEPILRTRGAYAENKPHHIQQKSVALTHMLGREIRRPALRASHF
jgi:hypothetical protein